MGFKPRPCLSGTCTISWLYPSFSYLINHLDPSSIGGNYSQPWPRNTDCWFRGMCREAAACGCEALLRETTHHSEAEQLLGLVVFTVPVHSSHFWMDVVYNSWDFGKKCSLSRRLPFRTSLNFDLSSAHKNSPTRSKFSFSLHSCLPWTSDIY